MKKIYSKEGFTLIEILVYLLIFSLVFTAVITASISLFKSYSRIVAKRELYANAQNAMKAILGEIKFAQSVYTPTSVFNSSSGQLGLATYVNVPPGDSPSPTYTDIYIDNQRLYIKHEGQLPIPITSEKVFVSSTNFILYDSADRSQSVSVTMTLANNLPADVQQTLTLRSGATLRGGNQ